MFLVTVVFAYRQFGAPCCARHETFRQTLLTVAALLAAGVLPRMQGPTRRLGAACCLVATLTFFGAQRLPAWRTDLSLRAEAITVRSASWASGRAPGDAMIFRTQPVGRITAGWRLPAGEYRRPDLAPVQPADLPLHAFAIMLFFEKRLMTVVP
jgi:hypothetical protein